MISVFPRRSVLYVVLIAAFLAAGCAPLNILNGTVGAGGYRRVADQAYGADPRQQLDVYIPVAKSENADVVVFFYGGRWQAGEKNDYRFVAAGLTRNGFITVIPDYRLYPQVDWRDFIADAAAVYRWVETHIAAHGGNPRRVFLMGHSAGAHIAAMLALDESVRIAAGSRTKPCGMIGLAGPYDFLPFADDDVKRVFSSATNSIETQPVFYVDGTDPSLLLLTGDADTSVKPRNTYRLAETVRARGGQVQSITYESLGHSGILISLAPWLKFVAPVLRDTTHYIRKLECGA